MHCWFVRPILLAMFSLSAVIIHDRDLYLYLLFFKFIHTIVRFDLTDGTGD